MRKDSHVKKLVVMALLIAMEIVLTRHLSVQTPIARFSFGFLPIAVMGMLYGPLFAGLGAAVSDFVGVTLFPPLVGSFFPGFTLTAFLTGAVYGFLLKPKPVKMWRVCAAALIVTLALNFILDSFWLYIILDRGVIALLPGRIIRTLIMFPIQIIGIRFVTSERFRSRIGE